MQKRNKRLILIIVSFILLSDACAPSQKSDSILSTEIAATIYAEETKEMESQMKNAIPTETNTLPSKTCTPSLTVTPTEYFPVKIGTPIPPAKAPISPESVPYLRQLLNFKPDTGKPEPTITAVSLVNTPDAINNLYKTLNSNSNPLISNVETEFDLWDSSPPDNYGQFSPDSKSLAICRYDSLLNTGFVDLWHVFDGQIINSYRVSDCGDMAYSPDGAVLQITAKDEIKVIDLKLNEIVDSLSNIGAYCYISYNPSGDEFIITLLDPGKTNVLQPVFKRYKHISISFWQYMHPTNDFIKKTYIEQTYYPLLSPAWDVVALYDDEVIDIRQMPWGQTLYSYKNNSPVHDIVFSSDGKLLAAGLDEGIIKIWQVDSGKELMTIDSLAHDIEADVYQLAFSPDNELLAVSYKDASFLFWQLSENKPVIEFTSSDIPKNSQILPYDFIDFSPDGYYLATGKKDGTFQIWGVQ